MSQPINLLGNLMIIMLRLLLHTADMVLSSVSADPGDDLASASFPISIKFYSCLN